MNILHKYLIKEILKYLAIILIIVVGIYIFVDFFEKIHSFKGFSFSYTLSFFILSIPYILYQITPVAILLSVIIIFGLMIKNNEIIALKSCGISAFNLIKPILYLGFFFSVLLFLFSEIIVPISNGKANSIWLGEVKKELPVMRSKEKNIWIRSKHRIANIKFFNHEKNIIFGITVSTFDLDFRLIRRLDAERGEYINKSWMLNNIMEQILNKNTNNYDISFYNSKIEPLNILPEDLKRVVKKSEEMSFWELNSYIKLIESEGYYAINYKVDLYAKTAFPFICIIMCILGTGISLKGKTKEGLPVSITYGIGIAFIYWIIYSFCISLGYGEVIPPFFAAWTTNLIFFAFGIFTLINTD